jgi:DMSO/TMAO reductase YedYZ molybdopterin-dependent catalytic subunit
MSPLRLILVILITLIVLFLVLDLGGLLREPSPELEAARTVEIRDYEGEPLSSVADFRENSIKGPQFIEIKSYRLNITGDVVTPLSYSYEEIAGGLPTVGRVVTLYCMEGWDATIFWEGVHVTDLLDPAGPLPDADTVIFHAYDGYTTSLPLSYLRGREIILAHRMNGVTLPPERGYPFILVAEDRWGYKWIRWVTEIELSRESGYRGYWESRGFSQVADINRSYFD